MPSQPKNAKDMPAGAEVQTFFATITKTGADRWVNRAGDPFTDAEVDDVLARGGVLTRCTVTFDGREAVATYHAKETNRG